MLAFFWNQRFTGLIELRDILAIDVLKHDVLNRVNNR